MATRDQLVRVTFAQLSGNSQEPDPPSYADIDKAVGPKIIEINRRGLAYVPNPNDIPEEYLEFIATLIASNMSLADNFGYQISGEKIALAELRLRQMTAGRATYRPVCVDYF